MRESVDAHPQFEGESESLAFGLTQRLGGAMCHTIDSDAGDQHAAGEEGCPPGTNCTLYPTLQKETLLRKGPIKCPFREIMTIAIIEDGEALSPRVRFYQPFLAT